MGLENGQTDSGERLFRQRYVHSKAKFVIQEDMPEVTMFTTDMLL
jgi:hypothetical protein